MGGRPSTAAAPPRPSLFALALALVLVLLLVAGLGVLWAPPARGAGGSATATATSGAGALAPPRLDARAAALVDADTGQLLYGRRAQDEMAIASTTKLMTALVTLERVHLNQVFTEPVYYPAAADSQIGLVPGERMSVHDLMLAMLLPSADDAAEDLAYNVGRGSVSRFIAMMNARARQLGLTHTHYTTPIGLDTPGNYSSPADLLKLARYVLDHQPFFRRAVAQPRAVLHTGSHVRVILNRNDLVGRVPWITGVKTGHTLQAGYVLITSGTRGDMNLIGVVLGTPSEAERDTSALALMRYGFAGFRRATPVTSGAVIARLAVHGRAQTQAAVVAASGFTQIIPRGSVLRTRAVVPREVTGPLARGARVGTLLVLEDGRVVDRIALVLRGAVPAPPQSVAVARLAVPITLLLALVLALGAITTTRFGRRRAGAGAAEVRRRR